MPSRVSGYNHPSMLSAFSSPDSLSILANRPALGVYPGQDWVTQLRHTLLRAAPPGLDQVHLTVYRFQLTLTICKVHVTFNLNLMSLTLYVCHCNLLFSLYY